LLKLPYVGFILLLINFDDAVFVLAFLTLAVLLLVMLQQELAELFLVDFDHVIVLVGFSLLFFAHHFSLVHKFFTLTIELVLVIVMDSFFVINRMAIFVFVFHFISRFVDNHFHIFAHLTVFVTFTFVELLVLVVVLHLELAFSLILEILFLFLLLNEHLVVLLFIVLAFLVLVILVTLDLTLTLV
jgi:hypothetical protein